MPLNHYVTLGRSGLRVSPLCLGAMTFGNEWGWGADVETSKRLMDAFIDKGGNFIDTANIYTKGHSEAIIGEHLASGRNGGGGPRSGGAGNNSKRDRLVIATKFMGNMYPGDPNGGGASRKAIMGACEQSLRRLRTDYIDLYWMHFWDRLTPIDETMRALDDLVRAGKVRYLGFSDTPAWKCAQAQTLAELKGWTPLIALQIEYSLLERTVEGDLIPMAIEMGMGVTPWSPLKGGVLSGKYNRQNPPGAAEEGSRGSSAWVTNHLNERSFKVIDALQGITKQLGGKVTPAQVALSWVQNRPGVASTIIGVRKLDQLADNIGALDVRLSPEQAATLDEVTKPQLSFPHEFLQFTANLVNGGTTVNGRASEVWGLAPKSDAERF